MIPYSIFIVINKFIKIVKKLYTKKKSKNSKAEKRVVVDFLGEERTIKHRNLLRKIETDILEAEFKKNPVWSNDQQLALAELLNVP